MSEWDRAFLAVYDVLLGLGVELDAALFGAQAAAEFAGEDSRGDDGCHWLLAHREALV